MRRGIVLIGLVWGVVAGPAQALTGLTFEGQVDTASVGGGDPYYSGVAPGDPISITFRFDESVVPSAPGEYPSSGAGIGFSATVDGLSFASSNLPALVLVGDRGPGQFDSFWVTVGGDILSPATPFPHTNPAAASAGDSYNTWSVHVTLPHTTLSSDLLADALAILPSVSSFSFAYDAADDYACDELGCTPVGGAVIRGTVSLVAVPEPSRALLLGIGLAAIVFRSRGIPTARG